MRHHPLALILPASLLAAALHSPAAGGQSQRWAEEKAWDWYEKVAPVRGVNYVPSTAVNMLEWWQEESFDPETIGRELGWAHECGYNSVRCNLSFEVWEVDPEGLKERLDRFFTIAAKHRIGVMLCLFDDVNFARAVPKAGKQPEPRPGVHNGRWVPSPAASKVVDRNAWPAPERYVKDVVREFRTDKRVLVWDLYNEPGNGGLNDRSLPLVKATFAWAREAGPEQPLTTGPRRGHNGVMAKTIAELSDVVSYHHYGPAHAVERTTKHYKQYRRPLFCTETIRRVHNQDFAAVLPVFARHRVSWYNWGLVAGKQQTYLPWGDKSKTINDPWHWDLLWPDGRPYDPKEIDLIRRFAFTGAGE
ncbi:MAG: glycoside hydrolase 5 family protein [Planctomycetota bacterium]|jgi:hypothetical protein